MFKVRENVGIRALKNAYDEYVVEVLGDRIKLIAQENTGKRKPSAKYRIIKVLPELDEYRALKMKRYEITLASLVDDAYNEVQTLGEEMREWFDNSGENLRQSDTLLRVEESADALENIYAAEIPSAVGSLKLCYYPNLKFAPSRANRSGDAAGMLRNAADAIQNFISDEKDGDDEELCEIVDELNNHADELESVEFPGMYG